MAWTSSTAVIGIGIDGATGTSSNNALIVGDGWGNFLEVAGVNDTVIGGSGNDSAQCFTPRRACTAFTIISTATAATTF